MKPVIVGLVFLAALGVLIGLGVASSLPVLSLSALLTDTYEGGPVTVNNGQIYSIETRAPLRFTVAPRGDPSLQVRVESTQSVPENFKDGNDVGITGRYDRDAKVFYAHTVTTKCPSRYESTKQVDEKNDGETGRSRSAYPSYPPSDAP